MASGDFFSSVPFALLEYIPLRPVELSLRLRLYQMLL